MISTILLILILRAECIQLGTINVGTGIDVEWPSRSDITALIIFAA